MKLINKLKFLSLSHLKIFLITDKVTSKTSIDDLNNIKFEKFEKFSGFQPYKHYIKKIRFSNLLERPITLTIPQNNFHLNSEFFVTSKIQTNPLLILRLLISIKHLQLALPLQILSMLN